MTRNLKVDQFKWINKSPIYKFYLTKFHHFVNIINPYNIMLGRWKSHMLFRNVFFKIFPRSLKKLTLFRKVYYMFDKIRFFKNWVKVTRNIANKKFGIIKVKTHYSHYLYKISSKLIRRNYKLIFITMMKNDLYIILHKIYAVWNLRNFFMLVKLCYHFD